MLLDAELPKRFMAAIAKHAFAKRLNQPDCDKGKRRRGLVAGVFAVRFTSLASATDRRRAGACADAGMSDVLAGAARSWRGPPPALWPAAAHRLSLMP